MTANRYEKSAADRSKWYGPVSKVIHGFGRSCRDLFDISCQFIKTFIDGGGYVSAVLLSKVIGPVPAANIVMLVCASVIVWGMYSWTWIGITIGGLFGADPWLGGFLGFMCGLILNFFEIIPELGLLFEGYADVMARSGKPNKAFKYDKWSVTAKNFGDMADAQLDFGRNAALIAELSASAFYGFITGAFTTTTTKVIGGKAIAVTTAKAFWPITGAAMWCVALTKGPEWAVKWTAAAVYKLGKLHPSAYSPN